MSEANKQLVRRWFDEVWNNQNGAAIDEMLSDAGEYRGFPESNSVLVGTEDFKLIHETYIGAFPDLRFTVEDLIAEGDRVAVRWSVEMTHLGHHLGIAPTGRRLRQQGTSFLVIRRGKFVEGWSELDMQQLFQQLQSPVNIASDRPARLRPKIPALWVT